MRSHELTDSVIGVNLAGEVLALDPLERVNETRRRLRALIIRAQLVLSAA